jgi:hypothetical protein
MRKPVASLLALCFLATFVVADDKPDEKKKNEPKVKMGRGKFTIGKETTVVDKPVDKDGYIDYPAALNERLREGVTPENNANVVIWKVHGPHPEGANLPPEVFKWLGIEAPPEKGDYFVPLNRFMKDELKIDPTSDAATKIHDEQGRITQRPWTDKDYPRMAAWLKANEKPLALTIEATRRTHYFNPLVPTKNDKGSSGLIGALLPGVQKCRELANALAGRAMLRLAEGKVEGAWQDLVACHRLGRLVSHGGTLIEGLVGIAIDNIAFRADLAFLERARPDAKSICGYLADLQKLPPLAPIADKVDLTERFAFLDVVMLVDRDGIKYLEALSGGNATGGQEILGNAVLQGIDWDPALKNANKWYDRLALAMRVKDRARRQVRLNDLEKELKQTRAKLSDANGLAKLVLGGSEGKGTVVGDVLITLMIPAVQKVQQAYDRVQQTQDNTLLAFALEAYRRDNGSYPKELAALAPAYVDKVPADLFSGNPLLYKPNDKGYLLYSVGVNGKDDGGRTYDDGEGADDLVVRMPLPELKKE